MGVRAVADAIGERGERLLRSAEHRAGALVEDRAHLLAAGLDAAGLHGAARWTADSGDLVADRLGAGVAERQLGQSEDPRDLLHGDAGRIRTAAGHLRRLRTAFDAGCTGLSRLDPGDWKGLGGDAFRTAFARQPAAWGRAASACQEAADALEHYAFVVDWAQRQAKEAARLWKQGFEACGKATRAYQVKVAEYHSALAAAGATQAPPSPPSPFVDPGADDRSAAHDLLTAARDQRDTVARAAETALRSATGLAPALPDFAARLGSDTVDLLDGAPIRLEHFAGGLIRSGTDAMRFGRGLNPCDPYNRSHPAAYLARLNGTATGLLRLAAHPERLPGIVVGAGWGTDGDEAGGRLVGNVLLTLATDGGSAAGRDAVPARGIGPDGIRGPADGGPEGLRQGLESAVPRLPDGGFQRYPDPRGVWTTIQVHGGITVAGRPHNSAGSVRAALETWYGNPRAAAARTLGGPADGRLDVLSAERPGVHHGGVRDDTSFGYTGPGPTAYRQVADDVGRSGHGSSALVQVEWGQRAHGVRATHVFAALNHRGRVFWWDPQAGLVSTSPIHLAARHVFHYVLDAHGRRVAD
ncbi:putative T7SS-secreted protein [Streptomyces sp. NBC_01198]|uniref:putative T7SS-secreted protein n=1 Tax=Streptomyces sp. NBC_01198 TaxID=2903769 RepID=UPI002E0ED96F|nr:toxin glutamine deamidase domain-containing protein [Streptomyces sp. NBC_01198]